MNNSDHHDIPLGIKKSEWISDTSWPRIFTFCASGRDYKNGGISACVCVCVCGVCVWVFGTDIVYHFNGTQLCCAPSCAFMHNVALYWCSFVLVVHKTILHVRYGLLARWCTIRCCQSSCTYYLYSMVQMNCLMDTLTQMTDESSLWGRNHILHGNSCRLGMEH